MAEPKKPAGNAGKGRVKGVPNRITASIKEMIVGALDAAGGQSYLELQAIEEPRAFMALVGRVLPLQVTGAEGRDLIPPETDPTKIAVALLSVIRGAAREADGTETSSGLPE